MNMLSPGTPLQGGKYRIEEPLAQNDTCITYLATWVDYNLKVCIKEFFMKEFCDRPSNTTVVTHLPSTSDGLAGRFDDNEPHTVEEHQRKFLREARTIARLDHPSIVRIHDRFEENNTAYYVMEFVEGPSLADIIHQHGKMEPEKARNYIRQIGEALHYMHEQGVTHLAVRPAHILVRSRGDVPILIDFSKAKHDGDGPGSFSPGTDVYGLAEALEELLTGEVPAMLPDVPDDVMEFLHLSECIKPTIPEVTEELDNGPEIQMLGSGDSNAESRIRIHSAASVAAAASRAEANRQVQGGIVPEAVPSRPGVAKSYMPSGKAPQTVAPASRAKTEAEKQKEKYNEVSQMFVRNMSRNNQTPAGMNFGVVLLVFLVLIIVIYYLLR